ncbi:MAG TPA: HAD family hydrolase [Bacilli bacterium]|jgi:2-hydroxy-3-keto-5-methylthiopentenyl-1-phosphate phosphatase|nr:haloacid dehalogenase-like hydrolase [Acholeplasmataceae bacterium]OQB66200.1 MAG: haloacid dehalogenase-like hydrolase [Tenericutes bacterium ADurb.Bin140]HOE77094.1 HAD family hydrolase [Bacilli bacterium]HON64025.1 HAD family hydrolase [Bacilli bacterium]HOR95448.1 HAD family hydrolase [Bacilli bacterium]
MAKTIIALMYDFDKTLCEKDMQEYGFIPSIGMEPEDFWDEANKIAHKYNMDKILAYMLLMNKQAKKNDLQITKESLQSLGKDVVFFPGVDTWFERINAYGRSLGLEIEHYIISSGLKEIIEGTSIAHEFKRIYACEFHYNERGNAVWPRQVVNFTTKTQFLFRISKGVLDVLDDVTLNSYMSDEDRRIPYRNMIYLGDGITDVPCMKLVKQYGGQSIALYHGDDMTKVHKLLGENRVNYICNSDYRKGSELEKIVKLILTRMAITNKLAEIEVAQRKGMSTGGDN